MRVFLAVSSSEIGGAERYVCTLMKGLSGRGVEVDVAFHGQGPMAAGYRAHARRSWALDFSRPYDLRVVKGLAGLIRESGADVVHTNLWNADVLGGLAARQAGRPALSTVHGAYHLFGRRALSRVYRSVYRCFERVIAASEYVRGDLAARAGFRVDKEKVELIPLGLDLSGLPSAGPRRSPPRIICVANFFPIKGQEWLVRAMPFVLRQLPECSLSLVGDGPDRPGIESLAVKLGVSSRITFHGSVSNPYPSMADSDIFAMPSLSEGFGLGILEAWAMGLPVVASRAGAIPELVEDGRDGLLVPPQDPEGLAAAILRVAADRTLAERLIAEGRKDVGRFSPGPMVEKTAALYSRLRRT